MFRQIRLDERALEKEEAVEIVKKGSYGVLSTVGEDGYPYGVALNYAFYDGAICFHCAVEGHKVDNINFNEKVSFCVVTKSEVLSNKFDTDFESAIVFGKAAEVQEDIEKEKILMSFFEKYAPDHIEAGKNYLEKNYSATKVIKIVIDHITGKKRK
ncbi:MAG: pyridoxamine 5'-phosphate oxidase family protein [Deltaproteobacteria bacterium]|nr:pyridoxamine 5'-phosphate oxidase family protein [Deltaproteobacteria bacterium]